MRGTGTMTDAIDWKMLRDKAIQVARGAYAPYSRFPVGAAALVDDRRVVTGCNVENVSYGLGLCAECAVVCACTRPVAAGWSRWSASTAPVRC